MIFNSAFAVGYGHASIADCAILLELRDVLHERSVMVAEQLEALTPVETWPDGVWLRRSGTTAWHSAWGWLARCWLGAPDQYLGQGAHARLALVFSARVPGNMWFARGETRALPLRPSWDTPLVWFEKWHDVYERCY